jgi:hypothetical protein
MTPQTTTCLSDSHQRISIKVNKDSAGRIVVTATSR